MESKLSCPKPQVGRCRNIFSENGRLGGQSVALEGFKCEPPWSAVINVFGGHFQTIDGVDQLHL